MTGSFVISILPRYGHVGTEAEGPNANARVRATGLGIMGGDVQKETVLKGGVETMLVEAAQVDNIPVDDTMLTAGRTSA